MNVEVNGHTFGLGDDNRLHSVRADLRPPDSAAILIPKALEAYGDAIADVIYLGTELERLFKELDRVEKQLRENGCTAPRPDLSPALRAAWNNWKGEGFWST